MKNNISKTYLGQFKYYIWLLVFTQFAQVACNDIPADNPYDPVAPVEIIRRINIKGMVLDNETSEPIIGATLTLNGPSSDTVEPWLTGEASGDQAAGHYQFTNLIPGRYTIDVAHPGYSPRLFDAGEVEPGSNRLESFDLNLLPLRTQEEASQLSGIAYLDTQIALEEGRQDHSQITVEVLPMSYQRKESFLNNCSLLQS